MALRRRLRLKKKKPARLLPPPPELDVGRTFYRPPDDEGLYCPNCEKPLTRYEFAMKEVRLLNGQYFCWACAEAEIAAAGGRPRRRPEGKKRRRLRLRRRREE